MCIKQNSSYMAGYQDAVAKFQSIFPAYQDSLVSEKVFKATLMLVSIKLWWLSAPTFVTSMRNQHWLHIPVTFDWLYFQISAARQRHQQASIQQVSGFPEIKQEPNIDFKNEIQTTPTEADRNSSSGYESGQVYRFFIFEIQILMFRCNQLIEQLIEICFQWQ